jgi:hypothetical protein
VGEGEGPTVGGSRLVEEVAAISTSREEAAIV